MEQRKSRLHVCGARPQSQRSPDETSQHGREPHVSLFRSTGRGANAGRGCSSHRWTGESRQPAGKRSVRKTAVRKSKDESVIRAGCCACSSSGVLCAEGTRRTLSTRSSIYISLTASSTVALTLENFTTEAAYRLRKTEWVPTSTPKTLLTKLTALGETILTGNNC